MSNLLTHFIPRNSCSASSTGVLSDEVIDSQGQTCNPPGYGTFDTFFLSSESGCDGAHCNARFACELVIP